MEPAVIVVRPDNVLTIGIIGATAYVGAVILVQLAARFGLIQLRAPAPSSVPAGTVAAA